MRGIAGNGRMGGFGGPKSETTGVGTWSLLPGTEHKGDAKRRKHCPSIAIGEKKLVQQRGKGSAHLRREGVDL